MRSATRFYLLAVVLRLSCSAQQWLPTVNAKSGTGDNSYAAAVPVANAMVTPNQAKSGSTTYWPHPYIYGGLALSQGASYSPAAGTVGGGLNLESGHFISIAEGSFQNAHKQDSGTGAETDLKGRAFLTTAPGWFFGGGVQWSKLGTVSYSKQAWRPVFGGGKDVFRENFSMRAQVLYVLPGTDRLNAVQGPEISLWMPSPASGSHFFYRQTLGMYEFHQTSVSGNTGTDERYATTFMQFTAMCRF